MKVFVNGKEIKDDSEKKFVLEDVDRKQKEINDKIAGMQRKFDELVNRLLPIVKNPCVRCTKEADWELRNIHKNRHYAFCVDCLRTSVIKSNSVFDS